ncbi:MAG: hypothetical protein QW666_02885 [Candidatus Woesearchaeota archaeon]
MDLSSIVEDFGDMPEFLKFSMQMKYQVRDRSLLEKFCKKYNKKLVKVCLAQEENPNPTTGLEPLYFFEGDPIGRTRDTLVLDMQDTEVIMQ